MFTLKLFGPFCHSVTNIKFFLDPLQSPAFWQTSQDSVLNKKILYAVALELIPMTKFTNYVKYCSARSRCFGRTRNLKNSGSRSRLTLNTHIQNPSKTDFFFQYFFMKLNFSIYFLSFVRYLEREKIGENFIRSDHAFFKSQIWFFLIIRSGSKYLLKYFSGFTILLTFCSLLVAD